MNLPGTDKVRNKPFDLRIRDDQSEARFRFGDAQPFCELHVQQDGLDIVTVVSTKRPAAQVPLFCHYRPVKLSEIRGNQVRSKTAQVLGWQEDLLWIVDLAETAESV